MCSWKREEYFNSLFWCLWTAFPELHWKPNNQWFFLKVTSNMDSETMSVNLLRLCYIKMNWSILFFWGGRGLVFSLNRSVIHAWFGPFIHWSFGKYRFTELPDLSHFYIFHYTIAKPHFLWGFLDPIPISGGVPHTNINPFSNTSLESKNSTSFWHHLPRDSRLHKLRVQPHRCGPHTHLKCLAPASACCLCFWRTQLQVGGPNNLPPRFNLQVSHRTQGNT